jgi:uncharacterized cupin superfamily protein
MVFCLRGTIEYEVGDQRFLLEPGDSLIFAAQLVHRWRNPGSNVANAIIVISSFEDTERPGEYHLASMVSDSSRRVELVEPDESQDMLSEVTETGSGDELYSDEI